MEKELEAIKGKIAPVLRHHNVVRGAIFGSLVRGEMKKESDIDILVEYSTLHPLLKDRILKELVLLIPP